MEKLKLADVLRDLRSELKEHNNTPIPISNSR